MQTLRQAAKFNMAKPLFYDFCKTSIPYKVATVQANHNGIKRQLVNAENGGTATGECRVAGCGQTL